MKGIINQQGFSQWQDVVWCQLEVKDQSRKPSAVPYSLCDFRQVTLTPWVSDGRGHRYDLIEVFIKGKM